EKSAVVTFSGTVTKARRTVGASLSSLSSGSVMGAALEPCQAKDRNGSSPAADTRPANSTRSTAPACTGTVWVTATVSGPGLVNSTPALVASRVNPGGFAGDTDQPLGTPASDSRKSALVSTGLTVRNEARSTTEATPIVVRKRTSAAVAPSGGVTRMRWNMRGVESRGTSPSAGGTAA